MDDLAEWDLDSCLPVAPELLQGEQSWRYFLRTFAILSPEDPMGAPLDDAANASLRARFEKDLRDGHYAFTKIPVTASARASAYCVYNISLDGTKWFCSDKMFNQERFMFVHQIADRSGYEACEYRKSAPAKMHRPMAPTAYVPGPEIVAGFTALAVRLARLPARLFEESVGERFSAKHQWLCRIKLGL